MRSLFSFVSAVLAILGGGCQPAAVAPPRPASTNAAPLAIWVAVDDPGEIRSASEVFQIAEQTVVANLKALPGADQVQILGSDKHLAIWDDLPIALIKVSLAPGDKSAREFREAFAKMKSLPVAQNIVLDETTDGIITVELLLPAGSSFGQTQKTAVAAAEVVEAIPNVADTVTYFDSKKPNFATMLVKQTGDQPPYANVAVELDKSQLGAKIFVTGKPPAE